MCIVPAEGRMLVPIPGQLVPDAQAPSPTGLTYANTHAQSQSSPTSELQQAGAEEDYYSFDYPPVRAVRHYLG